MMFFEYILYFIIFLAFLQVLYTLYFSISSLFYKDRKLIKSDYKRKIAIFIPAYKEDKVILKTVKNILKQKYYSNKTDKYEIIVIAQHLKWYTLKALNKLHIKYITYNVNNSTKVKALQYAIKVLNKEQKKYDIALILDADNHISENTLENINCMFAYGYNAVQCHRTAKNLNTNIAILDALSEEISNSIIRKGCFFNNLSASIIGSGIALKYTIFKRFINKSNAIAGFDKELTCELTNKRIKIAYLNNTLIFDEKVQDKNTFKNQRSRWIEAQLKMAKKYTLKAFKNLVKYKNIDFFIKSVEHILIPKLLFLTTLMLLVLLSLFISNTILILTLIITILYSIALILAIPKQFINTKTFNAILNLPLIILLMIKSSLNINQSKKEFIHTPHNYN